MKRGGQARASGGKTNVGARKSILDLAIGAGGVLLAASAGGLAVVQIASNDGVPKINGAEHFGLFSRPMAYHEEKVRSLARDMPTAVEARAPPPSGVDYGPVATIVRPGASSDARAETIARAIDAPPDAWRVHHVRRDRVALERNGRIILLRVGDRTPDGRRVVSIVRRDGHWTVAFRDDRRAQTSR
jgi:hypothetical protein